MVHGRIILLHNRFAALAIRFVNRLFDLRNCFLARQDAADSEEASLHDGVDARAHPRIARHPVPVDHIELDLLAQNLFLRGLRQMIPNLRRRVRRIEQEHRARHGRFHHIHLLQEAEVMACHKARASDQITRPDRIRPKAQVARRHRPGFLRVIHEIALRIIRRLTANDLDGVLVRAHGAVGAQSIEQRPHRLRIFG